MNRWVESFDVAKRPDELLATPVIKYRDRAVNQEHEQLSWTRPSQESDERRDGLSGRQATVPAPCAPSTVDTRSHVKSASI